MNGRNYSVKNMAKKPQATVKPDNAETTAKKVPGRPFKAGAEWTGNAAGRPKGSRHKLEEDFVSDLCVAWKKHGVTAIEEIAANDAATFVRVAASVIPKESKVTVDVIDNMSIHELRDYIAGEIEALGISHKASKALRGTRIAQPTGRLN